MQLTVRHLLLRRRALPFSSLPPTVAHRLSLFLDEQQRQNDTTPQPQQSHPHHLIPAKQIKQELNDDNPDTRTEALRTYWHSAAHVLGQAIELECPGALLCDGPPLVGEGTDQGFYYQVALPENMVIDDDKRNVLEQTMKLIAREKQTFERIEISRDFASTLFADNKYKLSLLDRIPENDPITVYRNGPFVDLCRGPHVADTSLFGAVKLLKTSASHFRIKNTTADTAGVTDALDILEPVQRVYGITFRKPKELKQYEKQMKLAQERDHRLIGTQQQLFMFDSTSPGSPFFLPHGTRIINRLTQVTY